METSDWSRRLLDAWHVRIRGGGLDLRVGREIFDSREKARWYCDPNCARVFVARQAAFARRGIRGLEGAGTLEAKNERGRSGGGWAERVGEQVRDQVRERWGASFPESFG